MNLLDLGLDQDLNQGPYNRFVKGFMKNIRVLIRCIRVDVIVKL